MIRFFKTGANERVEQVDKFYTKCWVDLINPSDDECEDIATLTGISEDMLKAALDEEESARSEFDDGNNLFVVDCPIIEEMEDGSDIYTTLPLGIIYNANCIVTVCLKENSLLKDYIAGREKVFTDKPVHFILFFMFGNAKKFLYCLKQIDRKTRRIQSEMEKTMRNTEIIQLLDLQNSLVYFSTSLNSNSRVHTKLFKVEGVATKEEYLDLYEDLIIEDKQAIETCNIYKNILSVTMDAYGSIISNNANDTMKKLTIITILLAIPTMIAGFWGMNTPVPGQDGYPFIKTGAFWLVVLGAIIFTIGIGVLLFKGRKMSKPLRQKKKRKNKKDID